LADILPTRVHVTVPRPFHRTSAPFQVHLAPLPEQEVQTYNGVRVTTPARAIIDAAATGTDPSQVHKAVREALDRGLVGPDTLRAATTRRTNQHRMDVRRLIEEARSDVTVRVKVSKKHQITIPSELRKQLGIKSGDELLVELRGGYAVLLPEPRDYSERLRGLHRQVWAGIEPKEYVRQEREAWRT
jgi:antitoxin PrlF